MQIEKSVSAATEEASSFIAMHLNETGLVEEFINKVKDEIKNFDEERKKEFIKSLIRCVEKEKAWHDNLCSIDQCKVKQYFEECLEMLGKL